MSFRSKQSDSDSDDSDASYDFKHKGVRYYPGGPLDPPHQSSRPERKHLEPKHPESKHLEDNETPYIIIKGQKLYQGGPASAVDYYARPVDIDLNEDMRPRHSIITAQAVKETFHAINTHDPYLHCTIPSWVQNDGPDERVLNSPAFVRAWHAFRYHYDTMWATLEPHNHTEQIRSLERQILKLDRVYRRALEHAFGSRHV